MAAGPKPENHEARRTGGGKLTREIKGEIDSMRLRYGLIGAAIGPDTSPGLFYCIKENYPASAIKLIVSSHRFSL